MYNTIIARDTPQLRLPWIVGHYLWFILCPPTTTPRISKPTKIYATAYFYTLTIICTCITLIIARDTPQLRLPWIVGHYLWFILCPPHYHSSNIETNENICHSIFLYINNHMYMYNTYHRTWYSPTTATMNSRPLSVIYIVSPHHHFSNIETNENICHSIFLYINNHMYMYNTIIARDTPQLR
jgi:hypothetical protein